MKFSVKSAAMSVLSVLVVAPALLTAGSASAQTVRGMTGSYLGGGATVGLNGEVGNNDANFGGNVQGRYALTQAP